MDQGTPIKQGAAGGGGGGGAAIGAGRDGVNMAAGTTTGTTNPFSVPRNVRIANKYVVMEKIGSGAFGDIYSGTPFFPWRQ